MKTSFILFVQVILLCIPSCCLLTSCSNEHEYTELLSGDHQLRKLNSYTKEESKEELRTVFFFVNNYKYENGEKTFVRFSFKNKKGEYMFKEMDINNVHIRIDNSLNIPHVRFYWRYMGIRYSGNAIYEKAITRVVVFCRDEHFPADINIQQIN